MKPINTCYACRKRFQTKPIEFDVYVFYYDPGVYSQDCKEHKVLGRVTKAKFVYCSEKCITGVK